MVKKKEKEHTSLSVNKKDIIIGIISVINILFYCAYNTEIVSDFFKKHNKLLNIIMYIIFAFMAYMSYRLMREFLNRRKNKNRLTNKNSNPDEVLISLFSRLANFINIFIFMCYLIEKCDFLRRYQFFTNINILFFVVMFNITIIDSVFKLVNIKKTIIGITMIAIYFIGIFDLNEVYFGTAFSILLTSIASLDQLKNIGSYLRQKRVNFEITRWINSLTEEGLSEDELNGKIELIKISIIILLLGFLTIIKLTEIKIKDYKNIVEIILYFFEKQNIDLQVNKFTKVIYTGIIRIIMVGILFIFLCLFRKIRTFIKIVFNANNKATMLWDKGIINNFEVGTYKGLKQIHEYLYKDIYDFAGKTRDVNLSKGNFRFTNILYLESNLAIIERMSEGSFDEIIEKYVEMNVAHPFREGNGRATRIWLDLMLKKNLNKCIDWTMVDRADYLSAMERSPVNSLEIKHLLKNALTDRVDDRGVYLRGIQQSYVYEDLDRYDIEDIEE